MKREIRSTKQSGTRAVIATAVLVVATASMGLYYHLSSDQSVRYSVISTATPATPGDPVALMPNAQGYVRVQTETKKVWCSLTIDLVACHSSGANWPRHPDGTPLAAVSVTAAGDFETVDADLGQLAGLITLDVRSYIAQGWSLTASGTGVEFINQQSGHGMNLGEDGVRSF
jgi:hypothetical protein